jgi:prephenate dehydrogenase
MKTTIGIIGVGMLGASLAASLPRESYKRIGWARRKEVGTWALENDVLDMFCGSVEQLLNESDIAVLCLPVPTIIEYIQKYAVQMKDHVVVTDIGSVKGCIERAAIASGIRYVGSHPMAGTEKSGPEAMVRDIYNNATVFIVPPFRPDDEALEKTERMWESVGGKTMRIDSAAHDLLVAHTSHVPHIVSSALALSVLDEPDKAIREQRFAGCASGFRDTIRVAASSPKMWREIISHNKTAVIEAMNSYEERCSLMKRMIQNDDFDGFEREFGLGKKLIEDWRREKKW